jgi:hypothetical protein
MKVKISNRTAGALGVPSPFNLTLPPGRTFTVGLSEEQVREAKMSPAIKKMTASNDLGILFPEDNEAHQRRVEAVAMAHTPAEPKNALKELPKSEHSGKAWDAPGMTPPAPPRMTLEEAKEAELTELKEALAEHAAAEPVTPPAAPAPAESEAPVEAAADPVAPAPKKKAKKAKPETPPADDTP